MLRFPPKCQSGFIALTLLAILLGNMVALAALLPTSVCAEVATGEPATTEEPVSFPAVTELLPVVETESLPVLPPVVVIGEPETTASGPSTLSQQVIERLPSRNSSVNELLLVLPGVQASDSANLSTQAGEIAPPALSISGGKTYQNNFQIDGQGINLILDPLNTADPADRFQVPSSAQSLLLNKNLLGKITVLDHNISARYGQFSGGVVDAKTRDPGERVGGDFFYRTTRDSWTSFQVENEEQFNDSNTRSKQPRFEKNQVGASIDLPISEQTGVLAAYQKLESTIPLAYFDGYKNEKRQQKNYFVKLVRHNDEKDRFSLSLMSTPSKGDYFLLSTRDSAFSLETKALLLASEYQRERGSVALAVRGSYGDNDSSRSGPLDYKLWKETPSKAKGGEGGYGEIIQRQKTLQFGAAMTWSPASDNFGQHRVESGIDYMNLRGDYRRPVTSYQYITSIVKSGILCGGDTETCIDGEQYLSKRNIFLEDEAAATLNRYSAYFEDTLTLGRLELRPGVRLGYDDYMKNSDTAYRLRTIWDLFGDRFTLVEVGANRYYGEGLLANKLREAIRPLYYQSRSVDPVTNIVGPWGASAPLPNQKVNRYSDLDTPFVDELAAGIDQAFVGGRLALDYIHRHGKDQFASELGAKEADGFRYYVLTNKGRTHYESLRLSWQRSWARHEVLANLSWQQSRTNAESYYDPNEYDTVDVPVYFHGKLVDRLDLPRADYSQTWIGNLVYTGKLPAGFEFTNVTRYRSGYKVLEDTGADWSDGTDSYAIYDAERVQESWLFDWIWTWRHALTQHQELALSLEIYNVFDRKVRAGTSEDDYELGRQLWAGAEYRF